MNNFFSIVTMQNFAYCNFLKWKTILNCDYTDFFSGVPNAMEGFTSTNQPTIRVQVGLSTEQGIRSSAPTRIKF